MILLHRQEYWAALDHLAVNLIILRVQSNQLYCTSRLDLCWNIAQTLEPLSYSPWFRDAYEDFFDHLEQLIWEEMKRGWRKAQYNWTCNTI